MAKFCARGLGILFASSWAMIGRLRLSRRGLIAWQGTSRAVTGMGCGLALLFFCGTGAGASVILNPVATPGSASAGSKVSVTGLGFPLGTIPAANLSVSVASSCGGSPTAASVVAADKILPTVEKVEFTLPSSLAEGRYFISLSGTTSNGVSFDSGRSCAELRVTAPVLTIDTTNPSDWKISNGALRIDFNTVRPRIFGLYPAGTQDNLIDLTNTDSMGPKGFYMDNAGFGSATPVPGFHNAGNYLDWWVTFPSNSANAFTYSEHFVVTPNDPGVHVYFVASHAASDITGSIGQVQWVLRGDLSKFTSTYSVDPDLSSPGPTSIPLPSSSEMFSTDPGRAVQDATVDLHGFTDLPAGFKRSFYTKYDYSSYEYLHRAHGVYGTQYGAWVVLPSNESLVGGPTKQNLIFTGNLDIMEAYSNHLDNTISLITPSGTASQRLFGPFYFRFNHFGGSLRTPADLYRDAVLAGTSFSSFYDHEADLLAAGYVPSTARGTVAVQIGGVTGVPRTAWAVLSDEGKNFQFSSAGAQYWADISRSGEALFTGVIPGRYRLSVYVLGEWGELRKDEIEVTAHRLTVVPRLNFERENFGKREPVFTIGTADRSAHEFLHGHDAQGRDDREFWGTWNYWADFQATNGAVIYNATEGPAGPATRDLDKWNYNHWQIFDPGIYAGVYNSGDDTTDGYKYIIPSYVAALPGASGTNGVTTHTPPWVVHFATPRDAKRYAYAVLSVSLASAEANYTVSLNGQPLTWTKANASDAEVRSGLSGYAQWIAFQWDTSALHPEGQDNTLTITVNSTQGDQDDALRLELTNTSADPAVRGWHDYEFLYQATDTKAADSMANP